MYIYGLHRDMTICDHFSKYSVYSCMAIQHSFLTNMDSVFNPTSVINRLWCTVELDHEKTHLGIFDF